MWLSGDVSMAEDKMRDCGLAREKRRLKDPPEGESWSVQVIETV